MSSPLLTSIGKIIRAFGRSRKGVAGLEFGIAAPALVLATVGVVELGTMMFVSSLVEGGLREAARFGITGYSPVGVSREDRIRQIIGENTIGLVDMSTATIATQVYPSFGDVGQPEPYEDSSPVNGAYDVGESYQDINGNGVWDADMGASGAGGPGDVVLYTVEVDWPALTPLFEPIYSLTGNIRMRASVAVRNEPFNPSGAGG
jgi:Flp pilus assembly protein TadG